MPDLIEAPIKVPNQCRGPRTGKNHQSIKVRFLGIQTPDMGLSERGLDLDTLVGSAVVALQFTDPLFKIAMVIDRIFKLGGAVDFH